MGIPGQQREGQRIQHAVLFLHGDGRIAQRPSLTAAWNRQRTAATASETAPSEELAPRRAAPPRPRAASNRPGVASAHIHQIWPAAGSPDLDHAAVQNGGSARGYSPSTTTLPHCWPAPTQPAAKSLRPMGPRRSYGLCRGLRGRLSGREAECFGMGPAVVLGQHLADLATHTVPKLSSQRSNCAYPAGVAGNSDTPSSPPIPSSAAATWTSAWVSTPPVMAGVFTMDTVIPFVVEGWHAPAGHRTGEPWPLVQARQNRDGTAGGCQKNWDPADRSFRKTTSGVSRLARQAGTQATDPTPVPGQTRGSRAGSTHPHPPSDYEWLRALSVPRGGRMHISRFWVSGVRHGRQLAAAALACAAHLR